MMSRKQRFLDAVVCGGALGMVVAGVGAGIIGIILMLMGKPRGGLVLLLAAIAFAAGIFFIVLLVNHTER